MGRGVGRLVALDGLWGWKACGVGRSWKACGVGRLVELDGLWRWKACRVGRHVGFGGLWSSKKIHKIHASTLGVY